MAELITVLIVDDIPQTREYLGKLLGFEGDIEVVGEAASGAEAIAMGLSLEPAVVLMDINLPDMDGITTTERLAARLPSAAIILMSVQGEADYLRKAMLAGAREFLVKPFSADELVTSVRTVYAREREKAGRITERSPSRNGHNEPRPTTHAAGHLVSVFSPKGGVGRTTVAVNVAIAAVTLLGKKVCIVDASLQFGDVGVLLNLSPKNKTVGDLIVDGVPDLDSLESTLVTHSSGLRVLLAPPSPETAELVTAGALKQIFEALRQSHDLVVVDSWPWLHETTLSLLDLSDEIAAVMTLEITNIKDIRIFLELADQLGYPHEKVRLVLNRADAAIGIRVSDVEASIGRKIDETIVSDGRVVVHALNRGVPFMISQPQAQVSQDILRLARSLIGEGAAIEAAAAPPRKKSLFARR
ncbi:MAG: AAA family ATPase [Candidatus Limnocylindrales bacterium]